MTTAILTVSGIIAAAVALLWVINWLLERDMQRAMKKADEEIEQELKHKWDMYHQVTAARVMPRPKPHRIIGVRIISTPPGIAIVMADLNNGEGVMLTTYDTDDYDYNHLCAEELAEAINDSIKQQNTQDV